MLDVQALKFTRLFNKTPRLVLTKQSVDYIDKHMVAPDEPNELTEACAKAYQKGVDEGRIIYHQGEEEQ